MATPSQHLTVLLPQAEIERLLRGGKDAIHPTPFAWAAWNELGGRLDVFMRASFQKDGDLLVDAKLGEEGIFLVAEVFLPRVTFVGRIHSSEVEAFRPVKRSQLRPVRQLLPHTAMGSLQQACAVGVPCG